MTNEIMIVLAFFASSWIFIWLVNILKDSWMGWKKASWLIAWVVAVSALGFDMFVPLEIQQNITTFAIWAIGLWTVIYDKFLKVPDVSDDEIMKIYNKAKKE